ncbi:hypothetical protein [Winogradskyella sediminis]|uniref:hypothetical protein n=1 Tax=Winogradskyella sediminis TaxID=1382466 RepID=UPI000E265C26|nr:hypothetical protein [Winogradskyella sediminis]REG89896.1 hypothetical protein C8N41_1011142 [Winogradskyella sediminis]
MNNITKYRGFLEWNYLENINKETIEYLSENNVIIDSTENYEPDEDAYEEELGVNSLNFKCFLIFDYKEYTVNEVILDDIYFIIEKNIKRFSYEIIRKKKSEISFKLMSLFDSQSKKDFLNEALKKLFEDYSSDLDYEDYKKFRKGDRWKSLFRLEIYDDLNVGTIKYYLQSKATKTINYYSQDSNYVRDQTLFCKKHPFNIQFTKYYRFNKLHDFILDEISEIDRIIKLDKQAYTSIKKSASTNLHKQVLIIDCLRKIRYEKQFTEEKIPNYFLYLVGGNISNYEERLNLFKEIIFLKDFIYNSFNASDLARKISDITGGDFDRLRKESAYITKPKKNEKFTPMQKVDFKNYPSETVDILEFINAIG